MDGWTDRPMDRHCQVHYFPASPSYMVDDNLILHNFITLSHYFSLPTCTIQCAEDDCDKMDTEYIPNVSTSTDPADRRHCLKCDAKFYGRYSQAKLISHLYEVHQEPLSVSICQFTVASLPVRAPKPKAFQQSHLSHADFSQTVQS